MAATTIGNLAIEIYTLTNRPDLMAETSSAIKAATLKMHQTDFYAKDLFETGLSFSTSDYYQQLDYATVILRFRAIKYLRKYDAVAGAPVIDANDGYLKILSVDATMDKAYKIDKYDVAYLAGAVINIKSSTQQQYYLGGFYRHPDITDTGYNSWIADEHRYAIIYEAVRTIFAAIGFQESASMYERLVAEQIAMLRMSQLPIVGE